MADFYRATKVELLDREFPGLKDFVDAQLAASVSLVEICSLVEELYGEKCKVNPQTMSNYYRLVWWKEHNADIESWRNAKNQFRVLKEEATKDPNCDSAQMIELLTINGIVQQREQIAATDPLKLMAELRRTRESVGNFAIEKAKIDLDKGRLENEKKALELKVEQLERQRAHEHKAICAANNKGVSDEEFRRKIQEMYGIGEPAEEHSPTASVSEEVGQ
jgi:hypothetical protein